MNTGRLFDLILNGVMPLLLGCLLYLPVNILFTTAFIKNYLADALWAYAFISLLLIVWERKVVIIWIMVPFFIAAGFELLQYHHVITGTGDVYDVISYFFSFTIALIFNSFFKARLAT